MLVSNDIDISKIKDLARNIKSIEHRLELKNINNIRVIDDSFNANEKGFKTAIDILKEMETKRIVITPGIIEQGSNNSKINYELGMYMSDKVDVVILVEKNSSFIKKGLEDSGFNVNKIIEKKNFKEAWECVKGMDEEKIVLIENDLPSIYLK